MIQIDALRKAFDDFSKATSLPGGPSLAMQSHDPTWYTWKKLCEEFAAAGVRDNDAMNRALAIDMSMKDEINATIERCAQWLKDNYDHAIVHSAAAAMRRALKDKP